MLLRFLQIYKKEYDKISKGVFLCVVKMIFVK